MWCRACVVALLLPVCLLVVSDPAAAQEPSSSAATCDASEIDEDSYRLTTEAQALNVLRPRSPASRGARGPSQEWWEPYGVWKHRREIGGLNEASIALAERAAELDDRNLLAQGLLARHYVVAAVDVSKAEEAWRRTLDGGGAIVWTATLYDADPRSFFVIAFDREGIRIYPFGEFAGPLRTHFGAPEFPGPDREDFWRALGGCISPAARPVAEIRWSDVRDIEAASWSVRFRLAQQVTVISDRNRSRNLDRLDVHLHPRIGDFDFRFGMTPYWRRPFFGRPGGVEQTHYEQRVRQMLVTFFGAGASFE